MKKEKATRLIHSGFLIIETMPNQNLAPLTILDRYHRGVGMWLKRFWNSASVVPHAVVTKSNAARGARDSRGITVRCRPPRGLPLSFGPLTWGSAALHPRLYAVARYRGLVSISTAHCLLFTVYCSLFTVHCSLRATAHHGMIRTIVDSGRSVRSTSKVVVNSGIRLRDFGTALTISLRWLAELEAALGL